MSAGIDLYATYLSDKDKLKEVLYSEGISTQRISVHITLAINSLYDLFANDNEISFKKRIKFLAKQVKNIEFYQFDEKKILADAYFLIKASRYTDAFIKGGFKANLTAFYDNLTGQSHAEGLRSTVREILLPIFSTNHTSKKTTKVFP